MLLWILFLQRHHPLSIYLFEDNMERRKQFVQFTRCGGMTIDDTLWHAMQSTLPFGGVGNSGMGVWRGKEGFDQFSHLKPVLTESVFTDNKNRQSAWLQSHETCSKDRYFGQLSAKGTGFAAREKHRQKHYRSE